MSTETSSLPSVPECWGGLECTINRVNDVYRDQLHDAGHYVRDDDIALLAEAGFKRLRYPILWERHEPYPDAAIDWLQTSRRLNAIREHGMEPIAGLLHHGSGPAWTDLLDDAFPEKLAAYALKVARQFPWIEYYTPVNEPLTTARFSGLYGLWYPHCRDERSFLKMLFNQMKGVVLSMEAIRSVNPNAKLVQTEDLGKTHSTDILKYQAAFENERRWLSYDLLCGKLTRHHPLWNHCRRNGISSVELMFFLQRSCPPDVMGFNYYVTSERWLDHRLNRYPGQAAGGNGRHRYIDTEAVHAGTMQGLETLLREAYERFGLPTAITECHLHCTREEQIRWVNECWNSCRKLNQEGIPIAGFTFWAVMGAYDWDSLLLHRRYHYEAGCFDLSSGRPRPTLLFKMARALAKSGHFQHPLLQSTGWWHKNKKMLVDSTPVEAPIVFIGRQMDLYRKIHGICHSRNLTLDYAAFPGSIGASVKPWCLVYHWSAEDAAACHSTSLTAVRFFCREQAVPLIIMCDNGRGTDAGDIAILEKIRHEDSDPVCIDRGDQVILLYLPSGTDTFPAREAEQLVCIHRAFDLVLDGSYGVWQASAKKHWHYVGAEEAVLESTED